MQIDRLHITVFEEGTETGDSNTSVYTTLHKEFITHGQGTLQYKGRATERDEAEHSKRDEKQISDGGKRMAET